MVSQNASASAKVVVVLCGLFFVLRAASAGNCSMRSGPVAKTAPPLKVIRVAVLNNPPYASFSQNGFKGPSMQAFKKIAEDNNWQLVFMLEATQDAVSLPRDAQG